MTGIKKRIKRAFVLDFQAAKPDHHNDSDGIAKVIEKGIFCQTKNPVETLQSNVSTILIKREMRLFF